MSLDPRVLALLDKEAIRELVLLYCRGVDRQDPDLLRSLYAPGAVDHHGTVYSGDAEGYVDLLEASFPLIRIGAHYVANHLIELDPDDPDAASGEVYALGYHVIPAPDGTTESFVGVRYLDRYRRCDGRWLFGRRDVVFDLDRSTPIDHRGAAPEDAAADPSYRLLCGRTFRRGRVDVD